MLHKSFKPAKCKTVLKLAVSRIKLLKNKREAQVKQLKRELAQLLESGQDQTARIRVEHVVREEKMMAAYDLIEIYCELIAARLPIIESQKNCPIDLKEAISSVIFASPRCSDIPELIDVRKHITAKYGKEFVSAALELRPDCGVNRLLVEKLSVKAPDGPTKVKILTAIAEEHNVKWEHKSFGENDVGLNTNEKASYVEPPHLHVSPIRDEKGPPNLHASSQHREMHDDISMTLDEHNASYGAERVGGNKSTTSGRSNLEIRSSGTGSQALDFRDPYSENKSSTLVGRQKWNMEFKDAASAAQAAAESAEHASMAARAAAELSNSEKLTRWYSTGSQSSSGSGLRDEAPQEHVFYDEKHRSKNHARMAAQAAAELSNPEKVTRQYSSESRSFSGTGLRDELPQEYAFHGDKRLSKGSVSRTFRNSSFGMHNEQTYAREQDNLEGVPAEFYKSGRENVVKHGDSASLTSSSAFDDVNPYGIGAQMADIYPHKNLFEQENSDLIHEVSMKRQASRITDADFESKLHGDMNTEKNIYFRDSRMNRQSGKASSSHFVTPSDDHNDVLNSQGMAGKAVGDLLITDNGNSEKNFMETSSYHNTSVVFDDSGSEGDDYKFVDDKKHDGQGSSLYFSSTGSKSQIDSLAYRNSWSPGQVIDEKQGSSSSQSHFSRSSSRDVENVGSDRKSGLLPPAGSSNSLEEHFDKNIDLASEKKFGYDDLRQPSSKGRSSVLGLESLDVKKSIHTSQSPHSFNNTEGLEESHLESGNELNYGTLKGGLRHKGNRRPPYIKHSLVRDSSSLGDMSVPNEQSSPTVRTSASSVDRAQDTYLREVSTRNRSTGLRSHNTSDSDSYDLVANSQEIVTSAQDPRTEKNRSAANKKPSLKSSITYFDSDSKDELPKQNSVSLARPVSGFSRRTSAHLKSSTDLHSNDAPSPSTALGWKSSSRASYESENQKKASSWMKSSDSMASSEHESVKHATPKPVPDSNRSLHEETMKSSSTMQPSSSLPKTVIPDRAEASNSSSSGGYTPSTEKASHVHPKLPDYDSLAAHFLSLKKGRQ